MKFFGKSYLLIICVILLISCKHENPCSCFENRVYKYPSYSCPDDANENCWEYRIKAYLLTDKYLGCSSTDSLAITCFNYPLMSNIWLYSSIQEGFDHVNTIFNGFKELFRRPDKNRVLINIYQDIDPLMVANYEDPIEKGRYMSYITSVEITLAQYDVIDNLTIEETESLLTVALKIYSEKSSIPNYSWVGAMSTLGILGRILYSHNYQPFVAKIPTIPDLDQFIISSDLEGINNADIVIQTIISYSENYLNDLKNKGYGTKKLD